MSSVEARLECLKYFVLASLEGALTSLCDYTLACTGRWVKM